MKFGKHAPQLDYRTLQLSKYLTANLPTPPATYDATARVYPAYPDVAHRVLSFVFPMDGNDQYGDCTMAALAHYETIARGLINQTAVPPAAKVLAEYFNLTGGPDSGLVMLDVLKAWTAAPILADRERAYVSIKPSDHAHVTAAAYLFGGVYTGFQVQQNCISDFNAGKPWTPGALTQDGHCVTLCGYDSQYVSVLTWGAVQKGTWAWWDECVDECYALLPPQAMGPGFELPGFDLLQLQADLAALAN